MTLWNVVRQGPSPVHGIFQARILEWAAISSSRESSGPRYRTHVFWVFCIASGFSLLADPSGKPQLFVTPCIYSPWNIPGQSTGLGSLSLFQRIFPTQRLNPGLPHWRWVLYQSSHKGSPNQLYSNKKQNKTERWRILWFCFLMALSSEPKDSPSHCM